MNIYIGNLDTDTTEQHIRNLFREIGKVTSVKIILDMDSGRSKGFGFVEMDDAADGQKAIGRLNETEFMGQQIIVSEAIVKQPVENRFIIESREKRNTQSKGNSRKR